MKNKKYFPYERNNYFFGKLLTVRDFEGEQKYFNDKRRLINRFSNGRGVIAGLEVLKIDDKTISIEPGFALDSLGREIIIDEPIVKRLSTIEGYDLLKDIQNVFLYLQYDEIKKEPAHSVAGNLENEVGNEYNRIKESYKIILMDEDLDHRTNIKNLYETKETIFNAEGIKIELIIPKYTKVGIPINCKVKVKKNNVMRPINFQVKLGLQNVLTKIDKKYTYKFEEKEEKSSYVIEENFSIVPSISNKAIGEIRLNKEDFILKVGDKDYRIDIDKQFQIELVENSVKENIIMDYYKKDFNEMADDFDNNKVCLAKINMYKTDDTYIIEDVEKYPYKNCILNNELLTLLQTIDEPLVEEKKSNNINKEAILNDVDNMIKEYSNKNIIKSGMEEIDLGLGGKNGKAYFSGEITHGLGVGEVCINVAIEADDGQGMFELGQYQVFGDSSVFEKSSFETTLPKLSMGVVNYTQKGTFRVGIKLLENTKLNSLKIKWWAFRDSESSRIAAKGLVSGIKLYVQPNTVTIEPRGQVQLSAVIQGTNHANVRWYVKENDGGNINENGVYTAPSKEGVYEAIAEYKENPKIKDSAFIVVKSK